jgi:carbon-monoxide dehydrogenase medium subunit
MLDLRELHRPSSPEEAVRLFLESEGAGLYVAGGTIVVPSGSPSLDYLVDLTGTHLGHIRAETGEGVTVGAMVNMTDLAQSSEFAASHLRAVLEAASEMGTHTVRNRATVGGNLFAAHFPSDLPAPFLVLEAVLMLQGVDGPHEVSLEDFYTRRSEVYTRGDLITEVRVPESSSTYSSAFEKTGRTKVDVAIVNCAAALSVSGGKMDKVRLALNGVSAAPYVAHDAMEFLAGKECAQDVFEEAARIVARGVDPRDDHRASADYRKKVSGVIAARALSRAAEAA